MIVSSIIGYELFCLTIQWKLNKNDLCEIKTILPNFAKHYFFAFCRTMMTPKCNNIRFIYLHGHPYEIEYTIKLYVSLLGPKGVYLLHFI